jgi:OPA family glycerol-3-phosphate transporter-like MFS transporter/OPA family sugar phosphate sensor protein UhpC-like MFS transporter
VALVLAGWLCERVGWRGAFLVPSIILAVVAFLFHARFEDRSIARRPNATDKTPRRLARTLEGFGFPGQLLFDLRFWVVGLALSAMGVVGYGFLLWAPTYLAQTRGIPVSHAALQSLFLAVAGALSNTVTGRITDSISQSRRMPAVVVMCSLAAFVVFLFPKIPLRNAAEVIGYLCLVGIFTFGPHGLLTGAVAADLVPNQMSGRAAGILDAFGYLGAVLTGVGTGWVAQRYGWELVFPLWAGCLLVVAALCAYLWNLKPHVASGTEPIVLPE